MHGASQKYAFQTTKLIKKIYFATEFYDFLGKAQITFTNFVENS